VSLPLRVVKVGGSLFDRPRLAGDLRRWLHQEPAAVNLLVTGGGDLADGIRRWDERFQLGEEQSHWLCLEVLSISAQVLHHILPEVPLLTDVAAIQTRAARPCAESASPCAAIVDLQSLLREIEPNLPPEPLPHRWTVTTDSLAARLAEIVHADELVLLKSAAAPAGDWHALAAAGYVDGYFPTIAPRLPAIRCTTLR
jgi:aspartokinase-like uncharacterized kinase